MKTMAHARLRRQRARRRGNLAEFLCRCHLRLRLWRIVARDWRCPAGEIDIVARRGKVLAFIEVKARGTAADAPAIERLHERTFGPGRFARTAFRIREGRVHTLDLSFTARIGTLMVGSVRLTPICIGDTPALLLGPLTVEPPFRARGVGGKLIERALQDARTAGHTLVVLVGDDPFYGKSGFRRIPKGQVKMTGPVDPARLLVAELKPGAFDGVSGMIRPDWEKV